MASSTEVLRRAGITSTGTDVTITAGYFTPVGRTQTVGGTSVRVFQRDNAGFVTIATGTTIPADGGAGWAKGATFVKTNAATGIQSRYYNVGTTSSALFVKLDDVATVKVSITNAQLKALRAAAKTLVAAPGANLCLQFVSAILVNNGGANAITESGLNMAVRYENTTGAIVSQAIESTGFIDQTVKTQTNALGKIDAIVATGSAYNKALVLHNTGASEFVGNAANDVTMDVWTTYRMLDVA